MPEGLSLTPPPREPKVEEEATGAADGGGSGRSNPVSVYRLARAADVTAARAAGALVGVPGLDEGFIHLSTGEQAVSTAKLYFKGVTDLMLLAFSVSAIADAGLELRYEEAAPAGGAAARAGDFPHCYGGPIPMSALSDMVPLPLDEQSGEHQFPPMQCLVAGVLTI